MSDADPEAVTVSADGITVRKTVDTEQFQTLAVVVELASEREAVARVQLTDRIPTEVPMDDVGFHPDYGSEYWSVEDGTVAFERDLEPGEAYTTIYGIRDYPAEDADALLVEPQVGLIDTGPDELDDVIDEERSTVVREFLSGEADLPGLEVGVGGDAGEPAPTPAEAAEATPNATEAAVEPTAAADADADGEPPGGAVAGGDATGSASDVGAGEASAVEPEPPTGGAADEPATGDGTDDREVRVPLTGGVVRVLIKELREGDVDAEDRQMLRDELLDTDASTETRLAHLQQRVSDLEAYADALEAFIDDEGTAEAIISDLRDDVAALERSVRATDDRLDEVLDELAGVDDRVDTVADDVASVESHGAVLADRLDDLEDEVGNVDRRVDDLGARLDDASTDVDAVGERTADLATRVDGQRDDLDDLRRDLRDGLEAVQADLEEFEVFRERLSSVFGGGGPPGTEATEE